MSQATRDPEQLVHDYAALWNERDYSSISDVVADSFVHVTPGAPDGEVRGPEGVEAFMREITDAFPDFEVTIRETLTDDETAMIEHEFTMTHEGEFAGVPATGREVELRSMAKCHVADGKLQELREYVDMQSFLEQVGAEPE